MRFSDNLLRTFKQHFKEELSKARIDAHEIRTIFDMLIQDRLGYAASALLMNPELRISESEILQLISDLKRLKKHEPIQYILGEAYFRDRAFQVSPAVLIPRPETSELIDWILESESSKGLHVLDIGTGSGCIAISLALELDTPSIKALDISEKALDIANKNARTLGAQVEFSPRDILNELPDHSPIDVLVSNPPYVRQSEAKKMLPNVLEHEPHMALFVADDGALLFYHRIAKAGRTLLSPGGRLYLEINEALEESTVALLAENGYLNIDCRKDLYGKPRMIRAVAPI